MLTTTERKSSRRPTGGRYPIRLPVEFRFGRGRDYLPGGQTSTISISSQLILIEPDDRIRVGQRVQIVIDWPARVDNRVPLKLHVTGRAVNTDESCLAIQVRKYEFRIAASKSRVARPITPDSPEIALAAKIGSDAM